MESRQSRDGARNRGAEDSSADGGNSETRRKQEDEEEGKKGDGRKKSRVVDPHTKKMNKDVTRVACPKMVWEMLAVDFVGPVHNELRDSKYMMVLADYFSNWVELEVVQKADAETVVTFLDVVFMREGLPKKLLSANRPQFKAAVVEEFLQGNGVKHLVTSVYHPPCNGAVERFNRVIKSTYQMAACN
ncbi:hypothetical protein NDU88_000197 [Pleurodeles waltl]|uniref:Integrase catalytic domain-containing protein n=1 Tax=Pleurodeles waltl TaxID=8319 RepID=A0AAV7R454_PLEWA|nr:hypothetical protein NDU88_000197 [Pleurodeles waltl]